MKSALLLSGSSFRAGGSTLDAQELDFRSLSTERVKNRNKRYNSGNRQIKLQNEERDDLESMNSRQI